MLTTRETDRDRPHSTELRIALCASRAVGFFCSIPAPPPSTGRGDPHAPDFSCSQPWLVQRRKPVHLTSHRYVFGPRKMIRSPGGRCISGEGDPYLWPVGACRSWPSCRRSSARRRVGIWRPCKIGRVLSGSVPERWASWHRACETSSRKQARSRTTTGDTAAGADMRAYEAQSTGTDDQQQAPAEQPRHAPG